MNCRDAERLWNELLDAREAPRPGLESALEAHAAACPACAPVAARYKALRRAIESWAAPVPSPAVLDRARLAAAIAGDREVIPLRRPYRIPRGAWLSAAAVLVVACAIGLRALPAGKLAVIPSTAPPVPTLADALADATSATLDLARDASAPAGRFGRAVLASSGLPGARRPAPIVPSVPSSDVLQSVGDRVGAGVRPLSGSARHAFGFLLPSGAGEILDAPPGPPRSGI